MNEEPKEPTKKPSLPVPPWVIGLLAVVLMLVGIQVNKQREKPEIQPGQVWVAESDNPFDRERDKAYVVAVSNDWVQYRVAQDGQVTFESPARAFRRMYHDLVPPPAVIESSPGQVIIAD